MMAPAFPIDGYRAGIAQVAESVFETMMDLSAIPLADSPAEYPSEFTGAVYYAGAWKGAVLLDCSRAQAMDWAARLMSLDPPVTDDDARDGLGELTNVIAGNLKPLLPPGIGLSIPSVVQGSAYTLRLCGGNLFETLYFEDALGPFRITLVEMIEAR